MGEQEAQDFARRLLGGPPPEQPEPGPSEAEAKDAESKAAADSTEPKPKPEADPEREHNKLVGELLGGGNAKREADRAFFESMPGLGFPKAEDDPAKPEGDE